MQATVDKQYECTPPSECAETRDVAKQDLHDTLLSPHPPPTPPRTHHTLPFLLQAPLPLERPRPVVTYMIRNFFSRRVLNDHSLLRYILSRYNVTVRVTTLEVRKRRDLVALLPSSGCALSACTIPIHT